MLAGHGKALDDRIRERQAAHIRSLAFEQAARLQTHRNALERALRSVRRLAAARRTNAVLVYPARRKGWAALWGIRGGTVVVEREVGRISFAEDAASDFLAETAAAVPPQPPLKAHLIDEMLLVHGWIERHREAVHVLDLSELAAGSAPLEAFAAELVARVRLACAPVDEAGA